MSFNVTHVGGAGVPSEHWAVQIKGAMCSAEGVGNTPDEALESAANMLNIDWKIAEQSIMDAAETSQRDYSAAIRPTGVEQTPHVWLNADAIKRLRSLLGLKDNEEWPTTSDMDFILPLGVGRRIIEQLNDPAWYCKDKADG